MLFQFDAYTIAMCLTFTIGYILIATEHVVRINKSSTALVMGAFVWILYLQHPHIDTETALKALSQFLSSNSQIVFFLVGALTIVEIIHLHQGFALLAPVLQIHNKKQFLLMVGTFSFFLSAVIDNLTCTVVMLALMRKMVSDKHDRMLIGGGIVIAANAGGAWSPIGDVTTTMLWIDHKLTALATLKDLFLPSLFCWAISFLVLATKLHGKFPTASFEKKTTEPMGTWVFGAGALVLVGVPVLKGLLGIPPVMGMLFGLGLLWMLTDLAHQTKEKRQHLLLPVALSRIDTSSVLFFLGILLCINGLEIAHILHALSEWLNQTISNRQLLPIAIGIISAVIDNVPMVAAAMSMYATMPVDSPFWQLVAYCAGTGGSMLIIGSAAGVIYMGLEKVGFVTYLKHISPAAAMGFFGGAGLYFLFSIGVS